MSAVVSPPPSIRGRIADDRVPRGPVRIRLALKDVAFEQLTRLSRCSCWASWAILRRLGGSRRRWTSSALPFCGTPNGGPGAGVAFGRAGADLRHPVTSLIAMLIGIPVSFGIALFLTSCRPPGSSAPWAPRSSCLAAIPSIIYGMWGCFVLAPLFQTHLQPALIESLGCPAASSCAVPGPAARHRHAHRGADSFHHGDSVHRRR